MDNFHPTPVLLPGKSHGWSSLVGCSPWGREESDTTERLHYHFSLLCIGEGNGNPLQHSCLENPREGGAWWAAIYGVAQSQTRLKWPSSSSSILTKHFDQSIILRTVRELKYIKINMPFWQILLLITFFSIFVNLGTGDLYLTCEKCLQCIINWQNQSLLSKQSVKLDLKLK